MKRDKIIYWATTGLISAMMLLSAYQYLNSPAIKGAFIHLGFPGYFRVELAVAKIVGAAILIIPGIGIRIKEWAYAGFAITFISAFIAHFNNADPAAVMVAPLVFLMVLIVSNVYFYKLTKVQKMAMAV